MTTTSSVWDFGPGPSSDGSPGGATDNCTPINTEAGADPCPSDEEATVDFVGVPLQGYSPLVVQFTDLTDVPPDAWAWTFGDATTGSTQDPLHTYIDVGKYTVELTAYRANPGGAPISLGTETKVDYIEVLAPAAAYCPVESFAAINWDDATPAAFTVTGGYILPAGSFNPYWVVEGNNAQVWDGAGSITSLTITVVDPSVTKFDSVRVWSYGGDWNIWVYDEDNVYNYYAFVYWDSQNPAFSSGVCPDTDYAWHEANNIDHYIGRVFRTRTHPPGVELTAPTNMKNIKKIELVVPGFTGLGEALVDRVEFFCSNPEPGAGPMPDRYIYRTDGTAGITAGTRVIREGSTVTAFTGF